MLTKRCQASGSRPLTRRMRLDDALPKGATYIDPDDGKTYRKR